jgi:hypothetical protein
MPPFVEDHTAFLAPTEFGTQATLDWVPVVGIFDSGHMQAFDGIATVTLSFMLPSASAINACTESILRINGDDYRVRAIEPDGTGMTTLRLERQFGA